MNKPSHRYRCFLSGIFFISSLFITAQVEEVNSLKKQLQSASHDSIKCRILTELTEIASDEEWPKFNEQLKEISNQNLKLYSKEDKEYRLFKKYYANAINNDGFILQSQGQIKEATELFKNNLKVQEEIGDKNGMLVSITNIGALYDQQGRVKEALDHYNKALKISEAIGDKRNTAHLFNNISNTYYVLGQIDEGFEALQKGLKLYREINDLHGISMTVSNIGSFYDQRGKYDEALTNMFEALKIKEEIGDYSGAFTTLSNIGITYRKMKQYEKAMEYGLRAHELNEKYGNKQQTALSLVFLSKTYYDIALSNNRLRAEYLKRSLDLEKKALAMTKELGLVKGINESARGLSDIYSILGKHKEALENYELFILLKDSVSNMEARKAGIRSQLRYDYEKQAAEDSVAHAKENEIKNAELNKQKAEISAKRNQQYVLFGGLALFLVLSGFIVKRFRITQKQKLIIETKEKEAQKQNEIISKQKHIVEEKQKEILDSINYAKRIQVALITSEKYIEKTLNRLK